MIFLFICWELHIFIHHILIISVDYYLPLSPNAFMLSSSQLYLVCVVINTNTHIQLLLSTHECGATQRSMNDLLETSSQRGVTLSPLATIHYAKGITLLWGILPHPCWNFDCSGYHHWWELMCATESYIWLIFAQAKVSYVTGCLHLLFSVMLLLPTSHFM